MIHVAVGVVTRCDRVLLSKRADHLHQGGLWEFPGGKLEAGESVYRALCRELDEELGLEVLAAEALLRVEHDYGDKAVLLDVWRVTRFLGEPRGQEGQALRWVLLDELSTMALPRANEPVVQALLARPA